MGIIESVFGIPEDTSPTMDSKSSYILGEACIPEILTEVLSHVPPKELLKCSLVCKSWNEIIKDTRLWVYIYKRKYPKRNPKKVPWYVYHTLFTTNFFDTNLIKNCSGQRKLEAWSVSKNLGDGFAFENPPKGSPPLPATADDFAGYLGCYATSYGDCRKHQVVNVAGRKVYRKILRMYKPHIYVSEWTCGRFDCGSRYGLQVQLLNTQKEILHTETRQNFVEQWSDPQWTKMEIIFENYSNNVTDLCFTHQGKDTLFWAGHYGSKMAGATVKILFDTIDDLTIAD